MRHFSLVDTKELLQIDMHTFSSVPQHSPYAPFVSEGWIWTCVFLVFSMSITEKHSIARGKSLFDKNSKSFSVHYHFAYFAISYKVPLSHFYYLFLLLLPSALIVQWKKKKSKIRSDFPLARWTLPINPIKHRWFCLWFVDS